MNCNEMIPTTLLLTLQQGCDLEFVRAGEIHWNKGTLINISSKKAGAKDPQEKNT